MTGLAVFGLAWCLLSLVFLFRACVYAWREQQFGRLGVTTTGTVVGEERRTRNVPRGTGSSRRQVSYSYPVVAFRTNDGRDLRASPTTNVARAYPVGETVDISYLPADPTRIRVLGDSVNQWGPGLAVGVGALFVLIGVGILAGALLSQ